MSLVCSVVCACVCVCVCVCLCVCVCEDVQTEFPSHVRFGWQPLKFLVNKVLKIESHPVLKIESIHHHQIIDCQIICVPSSTPQYVLKFNTIIIIIISTI